MMKIQIKMLVYVLLMLTVFPCISVRGDIFEGKDASLIPARVPEMFPPKDQTQPKIQPAKGRFLVASHRLENSLFAETVILLVDYGLHGASGLIINMPTEVTLSNLFPDDQDLKHSEDKVFIGGPVNKTHIHLLFRSDNEFEGTISITEDIYFSMNMNTLKELSTDVSAKFQFHVYAGYAGWGPGQLDREIMMGSWMVFEGNAELVFDREPSEIWHKFNRRKPNQPVSII